ncbi:phospholipid-translocating ATPase [Punctularia strigosozonata HHB-11173 SS5]|uniref:phospholipid-translocating ATPase n=1 Tax=Punctularia strigosozonata (strain HHB-11173) TaxID=741275 RepID=UPI00044163AA|nr:phospholipid-translocating ATPase [Punctularia strigosozonata HHB-11173 SS5]EIN07067.1 phospholipid-translocating ATPase [Punctularia strigosozonata HHB-11173 SS5]
MALSRAAGWYSKVADFDLADLFTKKRQPGPPRKVFVNESLPEDYYDQKGRIKKEHVYVSNQVITSKYTIITFLPRNLLEQFRRVANVFFLGINILQFFPKFSTISPGLVMLPLIIVLLITALKDGYEDIKRHQSDNRVNRSQVRVLYADGWENSNAMAPKTKTFIRGVVPKRLRRAVVRANHNPSPDDADGRKAAENLHQAAPPEATGAPSMFDPVNEDASEREYDDDENELVTEHGLFHHDHVKKPHWKNTAWEDVRVGDIVKIMNDEPIPADVLICATSEDENVAYVETKNLDGETNLKSRNAVPSLTHMRTAAACVDAKTNHFHVECDRPDVNMYKFNAAVVQGEEKSPVELQMTLLRGTVLRNTAWVIGVVLFTGEDTKIVLNSGGTPSKRSKVERLMNPQVFINLLLLAIMAVACAVVDSVLELHYYPLMAPWLFDDNRSGDNPHINGLITFAFALITFQNIIPISLYISIEGVRTVQAAFIYFDKEIWYEKTDRATLARSWNLSDDLGQIEYIFSDKTGTLTQNSMLFRQCSIGGRAYRGDPENEEPAAVPVKPDPTKLSDAESDSVPSGSTRVPSDNPTPNPASSEVKLSAGVLRHFKDSHLSSDIEKARDGDHEDLQFSRSLNGFFSVLALCHTVLAAIDPHTHSIEYKAQSPDEAALVQAAADMGFVFRGRDREILMLKTPFSDEVERYELLNILEFTSARKRMSIVVRKLDDQDGRLFLLSKGADNIIFERLKPGENEELKKTTENHLDEFANEGLRTLTLAYKVIPEEYYDEWSVRYHEATVSLDDREAKIEAVSSEIEQDLRLLGATAIEDRLQDGVPECIADLKRAGIKIWVATGDKLETAIAIGHSTNLIGRDSNIIIVRGNSETGKPVHEQMVAAIEEFFPESEAMQDEHVLTVKQQHLSGDGLRLARVNTGMSSVVGQDNGNRPGGFVLVVDGAALTQAFSTEENKHILLKLAMMCEGVICCRVSPLQKALVVKLVKDGVGAMTLAIGDGANDVSMIQAAHVGVGISGEEGLQAVNSSDYAIAQFRFLRRLLLVHGHWSYARNGTMIVNFFYKNVVCIGVLWWFQIYNGWSASYVMEYTYLLFWNSFWTIAPVIGLGLFDRFLDDDVLIALPELYKFGREGTWFGTKLFLIYIADAIYQSVVIFFFILYAYKQPTARPDGYDVYLYEFSTTMVISAVAAADLFVGLNTFAWTGWVFFAVFIGILLVWVYTAVYSVISPGWFYTPVYGNDHFLFTSAYFWFGVILTLFLAMLPRYLFKAYKAVYDPTDLDIMRYNRKYESAAQIKKEAHQEVHPLQNLRRNSYHSSVNGPSPIRPSVDARLGSRTDMSTGMRSVHRGFDFATEEDGVAMRRIQTNLSERRQSNLNLPATQRRKKKGPLLSMRRTIRRKREDMQD